MSLKGKQDLEEANRALGELVRRVTQQKELFAEELNAYVTNNGQRQSLVARLESALEQVGVYVDCF